MAHDFPRRGERRQMAERDGLNQNVAERGAFGRANDDGNIQRVGGKLIQCRVLAAAADDMEALDFPAGERFQPARDDAIEQCEAFINATDAGALVGGRALAGFPAEPGDFFRHVVRA